MRIDESGALLDLSGPIEIRTMPQNDSFIRLPNALVEALLRLRLSGGQWRVLFWTLRRTLGWNRPATTFTWYQVAKELDLDRAGTLRAARSLLACRILFLENGRLCAQIDPTRWKEAMTTDMGDDRHRKRCQPSPVFRRAIDMFKDVKKKERNTRKKEEALISHPAGAARPIPGKYDQLSDA